MALVRRRSGDPCVADINRAAEPVTQPWRPPIGGGRQGVAEAEVASGCQAASSAASACGAVAGCVAGADSTRMAEITAPAAATAART